MTQNDLYFHKMLCNYLIFWKGVLTGYTTGYILHQLWSYYWLQTCKWTCAGVAFYPQEALMKSIVLALLLLTYSCQLALTCVMQSKGSAHTDHIERSGLLSAHMLHNNLPCISHWDILIDDISCFITPASSNSCYRYIYWIKFSTIHKAMLELQAYFLKKG